MGQRYRSFKRLFNLLASTKDHQSIAIKQKIEKIAPGFDPTVYIHLNPDVGLAGIDAFEHFIEFGKSEGRIYRIDAATDLPSNFDARNYLILNPDVAASELGAEQHYLRYGIYENRSYLVSDNTYHSVAFSGVAGPFDEPSNDFRGVLGSGVDPKVIAFYLPQYHTIKENSEWWGEGFTEWTNVKKALPNFVGHAQPKVPFGHDYYDLADTDAQVKQAQLARLYGIAAFCYYVYWFDGRRVLEAPLNRMLDDDAVNIDFCICWANENWTRTWDGKEEDILLRQNHSKESDQRFIKDMLVYLSDRRYYRIDGKLAILVYRVDLFADPRATATIWRDEVQKAGLGEIHLIAVQFYGVTNPHDYGFDAVVEFPPHGWIVPANRPDAAPQITNPSFAGTLLDYTKSVDFALKQPVPNYVRYRGAFPGWDNTARRQDTPHIFVNSSPFEFQRWLTGILRQTVLMAEPAHQIVFINAWNEWGEGAHLEPDCQTGFLNLQAVRAALKDVCSEAKVIDILARLRRSTDVEDRFRDETYLLNLLRGQEQALRNMMSTSHPS